MKLQRLLNDWQFANKFNEKFRGIFGIFAVFRFFFLFFYSNIFRGALKDILQNPGWWITGVREYDSHGMHRELQLL